MANPRTAIPQKTITQDREYTEFSDALSLGSVELGTSRVFDTIRAEKITVLTDIQATGSVIVEKSIGHSSTGSWQEIAEIVADGLGSIVLSPDTIGVIPSLRFTGSSLGAGSVLVSLYWRAYN